MGGLRLFFVTDHDQKVNLKVFEMVDMREDKAWFHTASANLEKVKAKMVEHPQMIDDDRAVVSQRIDRLLRHIESMPKSFKWRMRAKVGTKTM